jgi:hypothetical protein
MPEFDRIVTHNDFDGVVSAAIVSRAMGVDRFLFTGPRVIIDSKLPITARDIVCDLPCPLECGLWFDHHEGNLEDVRLRGIDPAGIPGRFEPRDSCARVVYEHFSPSGSLPAFYAATVDEADVLDGFHFSSMEDWRRETPGKVVDGAIQGQEGHPRERDGFMRGVVRLLRDFPIDEVARRDEIRQGYRRYVQQEERMLQTIGQQARFMADDPGSEVVVIDFTSFNKPPRMIKKLAFLLFPDAKAVVEVRNPMRGNVKSRDLSISMSLGICLSNQEHRRNVGEIMRELNIGDGHAGAGAGLVGCASKAEMLSEKERLLRDIMKIWKTQS